VTLFEPFTLRGVRMRNRVVVSPMSQYRSQDGVANDWHLVHLGRFAMGGAGLVLCEATAVQSRGRRTHGDLGIWSDEHIDGLSRGRRDRWVCADAAGGQKRAVTTGSTRPAGVSAPARVQSRSAALDCIRPTTCAVLPPPPGGPPPRRADPSRTSAARWGSEQNRSLGRAPLGLDGRAWLPLCQGATDGGGPRRIAERRRAPCGRRCHMCVLRPNSARGRHDGPT
jgi:hypothetical protein